MGAAGLSSGGRLRASRRGRTCLQPQLFSSRRQRVLCCRVRVRAGPSAAERGVHSTRHGCCSAPAPGCCSALAPAPGCRPVPAPGCRAAPAPGCCSVPAPARRAGAAQGGQGLLGMSQAVSRNLFTRELVFALSPCGRAGRAHRGSQRLSAGCGVPPAAARSLAGRSRRWGRPSVLPPPTRGAVLTPETGCCARLRDHAQSSRGTSRALRLPAASAVAAG